MPHSTPPPLVGITCDLVDDQVRLRRTYAREILACGAVPVALPPVPGTAAEVVAKLDAVVFTGGDDPDTRPFGEPVHPKATLVDPERQAFELELLEHLRDEAPDLPVLAVCLGMQLMGLHEGGRLDQHLPDTLATAAGHWNGAVHRVEGPDYSGEVYSHHRQALADAGSLAVEAVSEDGVIEAVRAPGRRHAVGVQWHPERTADSSVGRALFEDLVSMARGDRP